MKSDAKSKIIILITLGILFAFLPIFINNPRFTVRDRDITSTYNNEFDHENLKVGLPLKLPEIVQETALFRSHMS